MYLEYDEWFDQFEEEVPDFDSDADEIAWWEAKYEEYVSTYCDEAYHRYKDDLMLGDIYDNSKG